MAYAILAAVLFGMSAPLSKLLLADVDPVFLAGLLYLGAGASMAALLAVRRLLRMPEPEAHMERVDFPWLAGAILAGGVLGPILLMLGLQRSHPATASLLLNLEVIATALIAWTLFAESVSRTAWIAVLCVAVGGATLSIDTANGWALSPGSLLIIGACFCWGLDNNLTGRISLRDPKRIVLIKGSAAGAASLGIALLAHRPLPTLSYALGGLALGGISYGASIALFVWSLRRIGAARTGALFGLAPFAGVGFSFVLFAETPARSFFVALPLMLVAALLLLRERHAHQHVHPAIVHTHAHQHNDLHHSHVHDAVRIPRGAHVHEHAHSETLHSHEHRPDPHHRHRHGPRTQTDPRAHDSTTTTARERHD